MIRMKFTSSARTAKSGTQKRILRESVFWVCAERTPRNVPPKQLAKSLLNFGSCTLMANLFLGVGANPEAKHHPKTIPNSLITPNTKPLTRADGQGVGGIVGSVFTMTAGGLQRRAIVDNMSKKKQCENHERPF